MKITDWINTKLGQEIWQRKYRYKNETFDEWLDRVSGGNKAIRQLIIEKKFLFGGRILANRGLQKKGRKVTLSNCYVVTPPDDSLESIHEVDYKLARTFSYGGGCGTDISKLAPDGAMVNNAAESSSGAISFMEQYSETAKRIAQKGRRGALMISMSCNHPDIENFMTIKSDLDKVTKANISVRFTNEFMQAVKQDDNWELRFERPETREIISKTVKAKELFRLMAEMNWGYSEPGFLNWSRICNWSLLNNFDNFEYAGVNP